MPGVQYNRTENTLSHIYHLLYLHVIIGMCFRDVLFLTQSMKGSEKCSDVRQPKIKFVLTSLKMI